MSDKFARQFHARETCSHGLGFALVSQNISLYIHKRARARAPIKKLRASFSTYTADHVGRAKLSNRAEVALCVTRRLCAIVYNEIAKKKSKSKKNREIAIKIQHERETFILNIFRYSRTIQRGTVLAMETAIETVSVGRYSRQSFVIYYSFDRSIDRTNFTWTALSAIN